MIRSQSRVQLIALLACLAIPAALAACSLTPADLSLLKTVIPAAATPTRVQPLVQAVSNTGPIPTVFIASPTVVYINPAAAQNVLVQATVPVPEKKPSPCDVVAPGVPFDVTVPDGSHFQSGETFSKTWRLVNAGTCPWTQSYAVVWFSGQPMGVTEQQLVPVIVKPGDSVDITVDMTAPAQTGSYQSNWKLRNAEGHLFGLGPNGDSPFWVQIQVVAASTPTSQTQPSEAPTLAVYAGATVNMIVSDGLDLDSGQLNQVDEDDFIYQLDWQDKPQFTPENGARMAFFGTIEPVENQCLSAVLGTGPLVLSGVDEGAYLCYRTSQGLPGFLRVTKPSEGDSLISLDFVTWTLP